MKLRKVTSLLLATAMLVSLVGCSSSTAPADAAVSQQIQQLLQMHRQTQQMKVQQMQLHQKT